MALILFILVFSGCTTGYYTYGEYEKKNGISRKQFRKDNRRCEAHNKRWRYITLPVSYGLSTKGWTRTNEEQKEYPNYHDTYIEGGCVVKPFIWLGIDKYCPKCQKNYRKHLKESKE